MCPVHSLTPGPHWFHCLGPDGPCVLLVDVDRYTVTIVDDGGRVEPWPSDDGQLHKWTPYYIEPVSRPAPKPVESRNV